MSLFVSEDDDYTERSGDQIFDDAVNKQQQYQHSTIVEEDEDEDQGEVEEDDPVIQEIPIYMNNSQHEHQKLYMLQYPTRISQSQFAKRESASISQARIKPRSSVIEVDIPMNVNKFFDEGKSSKWSNTQQQTLRGVFADAKGYFVGYLNTDPATNEKSLHLNPVEKTTQLRASFKYIDDSKSQKQMKERELMKSLNKELDDQQNQNQTQQQSNDEKKKQVHVVQMTAKSTGENVPRLGGALVSKKIEDNEEFVGYRYLSTDDYSFDEFKHVLIDQVGEQLVSKTSTKEYLDLLLADTTTR